MWKKLNENAWQSSHIENTNSILARNTLFCLCNFSLIILASLLYCMRFVSQNRTVSVHNVDVAPCKNTEWDIPIKLPAIKCLESCTIKTSECGEQQQQNIIL